VTLRLERSYGLPLDWVKKEGLSPSSQANHALAIYRDGILVADAAPDRDARLYRITQFKWPIPTLRVNLPKKLGGNVDVTRRALTGTDPTWDSPIWQGVVDYLKTHDISEAFEHEPLSRVELLGKAVHMFHLQETEVMELVPKIRWPFPMLVPNEGVVMLDNQLILGQITTTVPELMINDIRNALGWNYSMRSSEDRRKFLKLWRGDASIALLSSASMSAPYPELWCTLTKWHLEETLVPTGVRFLRPPYPGLPCLAQNEFECIEPIEIRESDLVEQTMCDPLSLDLGGFCALRRIWISHNIRPILAAAPFNSPFEDFFIGDGSVPNRRHPTTLVLLRCLAAARWHQLKKSRRPAEIGKAFDQLERVGSNLHSPRVQAMLNELWALAKEFDFLEFEQPPPLTERDFIPVSESANYMKRALSPRDNERQELAQLVEPHLRPFGQAIEGVEPENAPSDVIEALAGRL